MTKIIPLASGTRLRGDHNTFSNVIGSFGLSDVLQGDEVWTAPADGNEVKAGDQWLHVTSANGIPTFGWTAIIHKGISICQVLPDGPDVDPSETYTVTLKDDVTGEVWSGVIKKQ